MACSNSPSILSVAGSTHCWCLGSTGADSQGTSCYPHFSRLRGTVAPLFTQGAQPCLPSLTALCPPSLPGHKEQLSRPDQHPEHNIPAHPDWAELISRSERAQGKHPTVLPWLCCLFSLRLGKLCLILVPEESHRVMPSLIQQPHFTQELPECSGGMASPVWVCT